MAGLKDRVLITINTGLTDKQAGDLMSAYSCAKNKIAPSSRSTGAITTREGVSSLLSNGIKQLLDK